MNAAGVNSVAFKTTRHCRRGGANFVYEVPRKEFAEMRDQSFRDTFSAWGGEGSHRQGAVWADYEVGCPCLSRMVCPTVDEPPTTLEYIRVHYSAL